MFEELKNLVLDNEQMMSNIKDKTATIGFGGLRINAKVVDGKSLELLLSKEELTR